MRRLLNLLIGLAFAVRSLLPVGFMLAASPAYAGGVEIVICTGHGLQSLTVADEGKTAPTKAPMSAKDVCPFAPVGAVVVDHDTPHLLTRTVHYASLTYRVTRELFRATPRPNAHSARGPPAVLI